MRQEPLNKYIKMITDYRYTHTTYTQLMKEDLTEYDCSKCGAKESTKYYSHYERHVISFVPDILAKIYESETGQEGIDTESIANITNELYTDTLLDVFRVKCESCNATHAILPGDVVPYRRYSLLSMLAIVKVMYQREDSIGKTSKHLQLSWQYMLSLLKQWISHLHSMALLMRTVYQECINEQSIEARKRVLEFVCVYRGGFPRNYQKEFKKIIFMTHSQIHKGRKIAHGMAVG